MATPDSESDDDPVVKALTPALSKIALNAKKRVLFDETVEEIPRGTPLREANRGPKRTSHKGTPVGVRQLKAAKVLVLVAPGYHDTGSGHQECEARLEVLVGDNGSLVDLPGCVVEKSTSTAALADVLRVHDWEYVAHLKKRAAASQTLDADTRLSEGSLAAAFGAAGAAIEAVDRAGAMPRIFVAARPPGHHAGPHGAVPCGDFFWRMPDMCSAGFCLLNTVAIAAAYAVYRYHYKVAIVDFDIHHGNGTEAVVENLTPHSEEYPLPASWPRRTFKSYKPWLSEDDAEHVLFASTHLYKSDGTFYPGSGGSSSAANIVNVPLTPVGPDGAAARNALSPAARSAFIAKCSKEFRQQVEAQLLPKLADFDPDLLFFSAGFDAHHKDMYYFLDDDDFAWVTTAVIDAAQPKSVISVLEGGYAVIPDASSTTVLHHRTRSQQQQQSSNKNNMPVFQPCGLASAAAAHVAALSSPPPS